MDHITLAEIKEKLLPRQTGWCVSLFMPTHPAGRDAEQDPIRLKNLLNEVEKRLSATDLRPSTVRDMLREPRRFLLDREFWQDRSDGLAIFLSPDRFHAFRLPLAFEEIIYISRRFHVKPLLPMVTSDGRFYILALSRKRVRLMQGTRHTVYEIDPGGMIESLAEAFPEEPDRQLQFHTGTPGTAGKRAAVYYGHDLSNVNKDRILRWFRMIDKKIQTLLSKKQAPLVLAGVDYLFPLYREVNTYAHLIEEGIPGNPEGLKPEELHGPAWELVEPIFNRAKEEAATHYRQLAGTGLTTTELKEALAAACHGRMEVLFVPVGVQVWGTYDADADVMEVHDTPEPDDENLLDLAAIQCLINSGTVYAVPPGEIPDQALLAAVFRY